jgi:hypothetical protein
MRKKPKTIADNDVFVTLMRVAQEDADVRRTLTGLLRQEPFHRKSMLNTLIQTMKLQRAPADFVAAIAALLDDEVAQKAAELIKA